MNQIEPGRSLKGLISSLDARIMFKENSMSPLGDFPSLTGLNQNLVISQKALDVFWPKIQIFFEKIPIIFTGGGTIKRSGIWYGVELSEVPDIPEKNTQYFYLHPCRSLQRSMTAPEEIPEFKPRDPYAPKMDIKLLEKKLVEASKQYKGALSELKEDIGDYTLPPVFTARDVPSIYFTEEFSNLCKKHNLKGLRLSEIDDSDKTNTKIPTF
jgi:hypothetical protein